MLYRPRSVIAIICKIAILNLISVLFLEMGQIMGSILDSSHAKEKCQKFTSQEFVDIALNMANYSHAIIGKCILENSFGSGNFLKEILKRYIEEGIAQELSSEVIAEKLSKDIVGIELDTFLYNAALEELNSLIEARGLPPVTWSLFNDDFLAHGFEQRFDNIIGNPPYLSYRDIDEESRKQIRQSFLSSASRL